MTTPGTSSLSSDTFGIRPIRRHLPFVVCLVLLLANVGVYCAVGTVDVPRYDQWRFLQLLDRYYDQSLDLQELWAPEALRRNFDRNFGYNLLFIANAELFQLNTSKERWLGILVNLVIATFLYWIYQRSAPEEIDQRWLRWTFLPMLVMLFSMTKWWAYTFSLTAFKMHWGLLLSLINFWLLDQLLLGKSRRYFPFLLFLLISQLIFGGGAIPAVLGTLVAISVFALVSGNSSKPRAIFLVAWTALGGLLVISAYLHGFSGKQLFFMKRARFVLDHWDQAVDFLMVGLGASISENLALLDGRLNILLGPLVLGLYFVSMLLFVQRKMGKGTCLPLMLILYSFLYHFSVLILRLQADGAVNNAAQSRYAVNTSLGVVGCLWILGWAASTTRGRRPGAFRSAYAVIVALILALQIHAGVHRWETLSGVRSSYQRAHRIAQKDIADLEPVDYKILGCREDAWCREGLELLRERRLSLFRDAANHRMVEKGARSPEETEPPRN